ncbi:MAG: hypothetical protein FWF31_10405 [Desulfobulbus sp.]|nr:hypothetical protein [Desulfobulbus sp.]
MSSKDPAPPVEAFCNKHENTDKYHADQQKNPYSFRWCAFPVPVLRGLPETAKPATLHARPAGKGAERQANEVVPLPSKQRCDLPSATWLRGCAIAAEENLPP